MSSDGGSDNEDREVVNREMQRQLKCGDFQESVRIADIIEDATDKWDIESEDKQEPSRHGHG